MTYRHLSGNPEDYDFFIFEIKESLNLGLTAGFYPTYAKKGDFSEKGEKVYSTQRYLLQN